MLVSAAAGSFALRDHPAGLAWLPALVAGHFLLFCNVFRVRRAFELIWAAVFCAVVVAASAMGGVPNWPLVLATVSPLTVLLIVFEVRGARYHGVCARRWNPRLDAYLDERVAALRRVTPPG